jgi:hypothetical protein
MDSTPIPQKVEEIDNKSIKSLIKPFLPKNFKQIILENIINEGKFPEITFSKVSNIWSGLKKNDEYGVFAHAIDLATPSIKEHLIYVGKVTHLKEILGSELKK